MANKYLISGATYCGDGTTSSEAASAGAAGAWNDLNVLTGTAPAYGSLAAGDVVYIRSKTSAGANPTITGGAASLGKSGLTGTNYVTWIIDGGTIWSGVDGVLSYTLNANATITLLANNLFYAEKQNALTFNAFTGQATNAALILSDNCVLSQPKIDLTPQNSATCGPWISASNCLLVSPVIKANYRYGKLFQGSSYKYAVILAPDIELTASAETEPVFAGGAYGGIIEVHGGRIWGAGAISGVVVASHAALGGGDIRFFGTQIPKSMTLASSLNSGSLGGAIVAIAADDELGTAREMYAGSIGSRLDSNYPTLDATLIDSGSTAWSYCLQPKLATPYNPLMLHIEQVYSAASAAKTITLEMLVSEDFAELHKGNCYLVATYVDASDDIRKSVSTKDLANGALTTSTAGWSQTAYGSLSFDKKKLSITTPSSIKQDTMVSVTLCVEQPQVVATEDWLFICPAVQLS